MSKSITSAKIESFCILQIIFFKSYFLTYFNLKYCLYINLNTSKQCEFSTIIYHIKEESMKILQHINIESILFLLKVLTDAKKNY